MVKVDILTELEETFDNYCRSCIVKETAKCMKIRCPIFYKVREFGKILDPDRSEPKPTSKVYVKRPYTPEEIAMLKKYVGRRKLSEIARMLNRPYSSVNNRVCRMRERGELT